jgi:hypothetical protein
MDQRKSALAGLTAVTCIKALALAGFESASRRIGRPNGTDYRTGHRYKTEAALKQAERAQEAEATQRKRAETESDRAVANPSGKHRRAELARQNQIRRANHFSMNVRHLSVTGSGTPRRLCRSERILFATRCLMCGRLLPVGAVGLISADGV